MRMALAACSLAGWVALPFLVLYVLRDPADRRRPRREAVITLVLAGIVAASAIAHSALRNHWFGI